jgi:hypothetical protein
MDGDRELGAEDAELGEATEQRRWRELAARTPTVLMAKWASSRMTVDAGRGRNTEEGPGLRRPVERGRTDERKMACRLASEQDRGMERRRMQGNGGEGLGFQGAAAGGLKGGVRCMGAVPSFRWCTWLRSMELRTEKKRTTQGFGWRDGLWCRKRRWPAGLRWTRRGRLLPWKDFSEVQKIKKIEKYKDKIRRDRGKRFR